MFGFNGLNRQIKIQAEGQINTGKMMQRWNANVLADSEAMEWEGATYDEANAIMKAAGFDPSISALAQQQLPADTAASISLFAILRSVL